MDKDNPVFQVLLSENDEFRKLYEDHRKYEAELRDFDRIHYLTPEQEIKRKTIQKLKLSGKDQMSLMLREAQGKGGA